MARRIYLGLENSKYALLIGGAIVTIIGLFSVLQILGFEISGSDDICDGTTSDPCVSYGKVCNLGYDDYDIYNPESIKLNFTPDIPDYWIFFKDGRYKKEFLTPLGIEHSTVGWRYENFTNDTKPRSDRVYVHRFAKYSCQEYMLVGLKNSPSDEVKWGFGVKNEYLDPTWLSKQLNILDCKEIVTYWNKSVDTCIGTASLPNGSDECIKWGIKVTYGNYSTCVRDGIIRLGTKNLSYPGRFCVINKRYSNRVDCVTYGDGLGRNPQKFSGCQEEGGMNCLIHIFESTINYNVSSINSDKYIIGETKVTKI